MPVRDIVLVTFIIGSLPVCFMRPWIGVLMWTWIGTMTPHRLTWGFAYDWPLAQAVAIATLAGLLFARDRKPLPQTRESYIVLALWIMFTVTTVFGIAPETAWPQLEKISKMFLFVGITLILFQDRARLRYLALVVALSIGVFGLKGGIWALVTGGGGRVQGPEDSFVGGPNGLGLGLAMAIPMLLYLARDETKRWLRRLLHAAFIFSIPTALFTYSRVAGLGLCAVLLLLAAKARRLFIASAGLAIAIVFIVNFAPPQWFHQMDTIANYETDDSAMSRLLAWRISYEFALDHPLRGGGFGAIDQESTYRKYAPEWTRAAFSTHSAWFSVLGEHGFPGLAVFIALIVSCILTLRRLRKARAQRRPPGWVVSYSHMLEGSLVGYAVAG